MCLEFHSKTSKRRGESWRNLWSFWTRRRKSTFPKLSSITLTLNGLEVLEASEKYHQRSHDFGFGACGDRDRAKRPIMGEIADELADRYWFWRMKKITPNAEQIRNEIKSGMGEKLPAHIKEIADRRKLSKKHSKSRKKATQF